MHLIYTYVMITFGYKGRFSGPIRGVIAIILGIAMLFVGNAVNVIVYIIAAFMLASGLLSLFAGFKREKDSQRILVLVNSGFNVLIAILMCLFADVLSNFLIGVIGFILVLLGLLQLLVLGSAVHGGTISKGFFFMPSIVLVCGSLLLFKPGFVGEFLGALIGIAFIFYGVSELVSSWKIRNVIANDVDYEKVDEQ